MWVLILRGICYISQAVVMNDKQISLSFAHMTDAPSSTDPLNSHHYGSCMPKQHPLLTSDPCDITAHHSSWWTECKWARCVLLIWTRACVPAEYLWGAGGGRALGGPRTGACLNKGRLKQDINLAQMLPLTSSSLPSSPYLSARECEGMSVCLCPRKTWSCSSTPQLL